MFHPLVFLGVSLAASLTSAQFQQPFFNPFNQEELDHYEFKWPVKRVAIIGAGAGGLVSYRTFTEANAFETIRIFERDNLPGGNWHYTEETPRSIPIHTQSQVDWWKADYEPTYPPYVPYRVTHQINSNTTERTRLEWERITHRAPKPVWATLESNTPAPQQQLPGFSWPPHLPWVSHHARLGRYLRAFASWLGVNSGDENPDISYNTRVESVNKRYNEQGEHHGWTLLLRKFIQIDVNTYEESWWSEDFDAVVVGAGRFNAPHIPPIPGLDDWQRRFPDRILHSRQYRRPEPYQGQNILIVGAGNSATEISRDINHVAVRSYLSIRPTETRRRWYGSLSRVPSNTSIVGEIKRFHPIAKGGSIEDGRVELLNGTIITGIDTFIFGTGFRYAFPFLSQYHNSSVKGDEIPDVDEQPIVTDGTHVRSLFFDVWYINQPTIAFLNLNLGMQSFVYAKYISTALAKVWTGKAELPSSAKQWEHFWGVVKRRGGLKPGFQWLLAEEHESNLRYFVGWLNAAAVRHGGSLIETPPDVSEISDYWMRARYSGGQDHEGDRTNRSSHLFDNCALTWDMESEKQGNFMRAALDDW
ncbi:FAD/NAD(P)-binding domain-containing protein [Flagelloscypha sp. PMI_526]|nr:FAD/NAD(P)-binding domain-containing protein [Flagelloscypha sp. PMI_526]